MKISHSRSAATASEWSHLTPLHSSGMDPKSEPLVRWIFVFCFESLIESTRSWEYLHPTNEQTFLIKHRPSMSWLGLSLAWRRADDKTGAVAFPTITTSTNNQQQQATVVVSTVPRVTTMRWRGSSVAVFALSAARASMSI